MRTMAIIAAMCAAAAGVPAQAPTQVRVQATPFETAPGQQAPQGTLSGTVREKGTQKLVERVQIEAVGPNGFNGGSITDTEGRFLIKGPPGSYRLTIRRRGNTGNLGVPAVKVTTVRLDEETKLEIEMPKTAEVSGRVLDPRGEPVPGARVTFLMRAYEAWSTNRIAQNTPFTAQTNDVGEYIISEIPEDIPFYIYAEPQGAAAAPPSETLAADPAARRPMLASTFYPSSIDPGAAQEIMFSEGQRREDVDIKMQRTQPYCVEDTVLPRRMDGVKYSIMIDPVYIGSGVFNDYGSYRTGRTLFLDDQGKVRVCGLWPGDYKFTIQPQNMVNNEVFFGRGEFTVKDADINHLVIRDASQMPVEGEVTIDGPAPEKPVTSRVNIDLVPVTSFTRGGGASSTVPGKFVFESVKREKFFMRVSGVPDGYYIKSEVYGDEDVALKSARFVLDKPNTPLKIVLAPKGARLKVKVADSNGNPVIGSRVMLVRAGLNEAPRLVGQLWLSYSDERGEATTFTLTLEPPRSMFKPGDYVLLATDLPYNQNADVLDRVWTALRDSGTKVTLQPDATAEVTIRPVKLR